MNQDIEPFIEEVINFTQRFGRKPKIFITGNFSFFPDVTRLYGVRICRDPNMSYRIGYLLDLEMLRFINQVKRKHKVRLLEWI